MDADRLLSGDESGSVLLWDIATGQQIAHVKAHAEDVSCLAVTPDCHCFMSGSLDNSLKLWRLEALTQPVIHFSGHTDDVFACAVSSDGRRLYSGGSDNSIRVWDMTTGQQLTCIQSHSGGVTSLALSGSLLISGSYFKTVKLWDALSMQLLHSLRGHLTPVRSVAVNSEGCQRVLSGGGARFGRKDYSVRVWDAASGAQLAVLQGHTDDVNCITVSADGRVAASASENGAICMWDLASLSFRARFNGHESSVCSVLFV